MNAPSNSSISSRWWAVALRGFVYLAFGITAVAWPELTFGVLLLLFAVFAFVDGVLTLIAAARTGRAGEPWPGLVVEGVVSAAVGILVFVWPGISALVLLYVIGAWALLTGVFEIVGAVRLRREIEGEWLLVLGGALSVAFGIVVFLWPAGSALAVVWALGVYAGLFGLLLVVLSLIMRSHVRAGSAGGPPDPRAVSG